MSPQWNTWGAVTPVTTRRHVGGTLDMNKDELKCGKSENSYTENIRRLCTSTVA